MHFTRYTVWRIRNDDLSPVIARREVTKQSLFLFPIYGAGFPAPLDKHRDCVNSAIWFLHKELLENTGLINYLIG